MKKFLSFILMISIMISAFSVCICVCAQENDTQTIEVDSKNTEDTQTSDTDIATQQPQDILYFSCVYDSETKTVNVSGTMKHNAFAQYNNSSLEIFLIPPGMTELEVANAPNSEPLAKTSVSIKFGFNFKVSKLIDRYSRYAIFLKSPDGERILASAAQYADVKSTFEAITDKSTFKGISGAVSSNASFIDADTVIIPIRFDMLFTDTSNGYIYQCDSKRLFFSQGYIDELDKKVSSARISGSAIYLQYLFVGGDEEGSPSYVMPELYDENQLTLIHSATDFLSGRYASDRDLGAFGFIVGKGWDNYGIYNYYENVTFEKYVELCGFYAIVVSNAARSVNSSIDIVLPFTGDGFKKDASVETEAQRFYVNQLLAALLEYFENSFSTGINFSLMMETSEVPFNITNENISLGVDTSYRNTESDFCAGYQNEFSSFIEALDSEYSGKLTNYIFLWAPPATLSGNALATAYSYSYYILLGDNRVSSFVVDFNENNANNFEDILYIIKHIDSTESVLVTNNILEYFDCISWGEVLGTEINNTKKLKSIYAVSPKFTVPEGLRGSFSYFDFSNSTLFDGWYKGSGCNKVKIEYSADDRKALKAELSVSDGRWSELIYFYGYKENMGYTPYLKFSFGINDELKSSLYEIITVVESDNIRFESSCIISGNSVSDMILDLSDYTSFGTVDNFKFFVRALDGDAEKCTLLLYDITGYSTEYTSDELKNLIYNEREKTQEESNGKEQALPWKNIAIAAGIVLVTGIFGAAIIFGFKKEK